MNYRKVAARALSTVGMFAIGDGVTTAVAPRDHIGLWTFKSAPRWYKSSAHAAKRDRTRSLLVACGSLAIGIGFIWAAQRLA